MKPKFLNMLEVTLKPAVHKVALWQGKTIGDSRAFAKEHGLPVFPIGNADGRMGLLIPSRDMYGKTQDVAVVRGEYVLVVEDHNGTWLRPITQAELDATYDYEREVSE